jgi:2-polyprenyl-3-methyl-5-hydroxy-6-metoxy-1,4-benzoquinol methylase
MGNYVENSNKNEVLYASVQAADSDYFYFVRSEIRPLLPDNAVKVLDLGAGAGVTLKWIKSVFPKCHTTAVEINSALLPKLRQNVDLPIISSLDESILQLDASYDLILMLDVLEHLPDPQRTLQRFSKLLSKETGRVIVSLPNLAHLSISLPLLFKRRFEYQDAGILDRTHLRFFVEDTAIRLLNDAGLIVKKGIVNGLRGPRAKLVNRLTFGLLRHHLTKQYVMMGQPNVDCSVQTKVQWSIE